MSEANVAYSMLRREAENFILRLTGFDVRSHPLAKMAFEGALRRYDPQIRSFLGMLTSDPPDSVDAAVGVLKDEGAAKLDAFSEKFKARLQEQKNKEQ